MRDPITLTQDRDIDLNERYRRASDFLFGRLNYEKVPDRARTIDDFKLARMQELLSILENPQLKVPTIHVAGSKGKGSTASMIAGVLQSAGYRVGLFTSPHIAHYEERFATDGCHASKAEIVAHVERLRPVVDEMDRQSEAGGPTFFELTTAIGWLHFLSQRVDVAVVEVGLGGRLDSTNVCDPLVSIITSISRDHTRLLGDTVEEIAREKAGIIKRGKPVVSGVTAPGPAEVIAEIARAHEAPLYRLDEEFRATAELRGTHASRQEPPCYSMDVTGPRGSLSGIQLSMPGEHQVRNAAVAIIACQLLRDHGFALRDESIARSIETVQCPLRVEVVKRAPLVIVDAAHNPASMDALCETLSHVEASHRKVVFACSRDKDPRALLGIVTRYFDEVLLTRFSENPRALTCAELEPIARSVLTIPWRWVESLPEAMQSASDSSTKDDLICITGSFFLAAEAKQLLAR